MKDMRPMLSDTGIGSIHTGQRARPVVYRVRTDYRSGILEAKSEMERLAAASGRSAAPPDPIPFSEEKTKPDYAVILATAVIIVLILVVVFLLVIISGYL